MFIDIGVKFENSRGKNIFGKNFGMIRITPAAGQCNSQKNKSLAGAAVN
jgi:hypothetical protein